jgi:hypothetical protein
MQFVATVVAHETRLSAQSEANLLLQWEVATIKG